MSRVAYVNGLYAPIGEACVHIEDRGFQFADGVYEVWAVLDARLVEWEGHAARLERSLGELGMPAPMSRPALKVVLKETLRRNRVRDGIVYLQVTRGTHPRDHAYPPQGTPQTVVVTARKLDYRVLEARAAKGVAVVTTPENRWARCDIKTVGLLPNAMAKQAARAAGAYEAWFVDGEGLVTEGSSTNAWIVDAEGRLRTRDAGANILRGVTRRSLLDLARESGVEAVEGPFSVEDVLTAREAFITSASAFVMPVTSIDGRPIGNGAPGILTGRLRSLYLEHARSTAV